MPATLRILDTGLMPPRWNVAMTAALAELHAREAPASADPQRMPGLRATPATTSFPRRREPSPPRVKGILANAVARRFPASRLAARQDNPRCDTVRFHRYRPCVLLGAGQDMERAADVGYCRTAGIEIARRVTGGGAVYMSPGMLAWDFLVDRSEFGGDLAAVTERVCGGVAAGLSRLGASARFQGPNDIQIGGRKVSGSAGYMAGRVVVLQGTVLIGDDVRAMAHALRLPEAELTARVTCLAAEIGTAPCLPTVIDCITMGLSAALDREPVRARPREDEIALCNELLRDEIGTEAYVTGRPVAPA